jgi:hypothetical protein
MANAQRIPLAEIVEVPWMISTSVSNIHISVAENGACRLLADTFWGHHRAEGQYRRVAIDFFAVAAVYYGIFRGDNEYGGRGPIDWTNVHTMKPTSEIELDAWLDARANRWEATGVSPDSHFYRIIGSNWVDDYCGQPGHFLLCGHDAFVEVLASGYEWSEIEFLTS